jgi:hypothetical protein
VAVTDTLPVMTGVDVEVTEKLDREEALGTLESVAVSVLPPLPPLLPVKVGELDPVLEAKEEGEVETDALSPLALGAKGVRLPDAEARMEKLVLGEPLPSASVAEPQGEGAPEALNVAEGLVVLDPRGNDTVALLEEEGGSVPPLDTDASREEEEVLLGKELAVPTDDALAVPLPTPPSPPLEEYAGEWEGRVPLDVGAGFFETLGDEESDTLGEEELNPLCVASKLASAVPEKPPLPLITPVLVAPPIAMEGVAALLKDTALLPVTVPLKASEYEVLGEIVDDTEPLELCENDAHAVPATENVGESVEE